MSDDVILPDSPEPEGSEPSAPAEKDWVGEAKKIGWNDKYDGPDKVDAKEFVLRKPLFDQIHSLKKKSRELESAVKHQRMVQEKLIEQERKKVMEELGSQRDKAIEDGDKGKVAKIEREMAEQNAAYNAASPKEPPKEFLDFVSENEWYESNPKLRRYADALGNELYAQDKSRPLKEIYLEVAKEVRDTFPQHFKNPNREKPASVDTTTPKATASKEELGWDDIPREYRRVAEAQWKAGAFVDKVGKQLSRRDAMRLYAEELRKVGAI